MRRRRVPVRGGRPRVVKTDPYPPNYGAYKSYVPIGGSTAGVPAGTVLTAQTGDIVVNSGGTYDSILLTGRFIINTTQTVIIRRCRVLGPQSALTSGPVGLIHCMTSTNMVTDVRVYDCDLHCYWPTEWIEGIRGHHYIAERNDIKWVVDTFQVFNTLSVPKGATNVQLRGNHCHDLSYWYPDSFHANGTHNDCLQVQGSLNPIVSVGNNYDGHLAPEGTTTPWGKPVGTTVAASEDPAKPGTFYRYADSTANSCFQMGLEQATKCSVNSDGDRFHGGVWGQVNIPAAVGNEPTQGFGSFTNGRYGLDSHQGSSYQLNTNGVLLSGTGTYSNNFNDDGGSTAIRVR